MATEVDIQRMMRVFGVDHADAERRLAAAAARTAMRAVTPNDQPVADVVPLPEDA